MADLLLVALACGLSAAFLLLLLAGLSVYLLWRKRQAQILYRGLIPTTPTIPRCTTPVLQTSQNGSYGSGDVPFIVPPRFKRASQIKEKREGREDAEEWEHHPDLHTQRGSLTVGSWFPLGRLRPDLYQLPEEPGEWALPNGSAVRLWFALRYQDEREQLVVSLLRAANLPSLCQGNITLVKLQLLPSDERRHRQAKAKRKGRHPTFNDSFVFQVSNSCVDQCSVHMSLFTVEQRKHHLIGQILIPLRHTELKEAAGKVQWRDLDNESDQPLSKNGDIQVSLNYNPSLHRLTVVVLRARGLQCGSDAGVCVQVSLKIHTQVVRNKWTTVAKGINPSFNERLTFRLLPMQLDTACLSLQLQQPITEEPVSLGVVVIGPFMYARGRELDHWNDMVSKPQELVREWHALGMASSLTSMHQV
ncbi:synaptotagmin-15 [Triplophysa rosa]|uniref:Synaptotagmin-15 n=1 Tax=Triplophysa rosa TaxID=992332 RepID=A0A9W7TGT6_TRIRA|nr:synaptotagmin-15 [Triplophysa rosa]KAI7797067.1 putative synaptotagmin-15 [Triplophysa rosa]